MDLRREYHCRMLEIFMSCYGNIIENASDGHCMKVTGFPLEVLPELRNKINSRETQAECYILSETLSGSEYITPTKLIELRNDLTKPILIQTPQPLQRSLSTRIVPLIFAIRHPFIISCLQMYAFFTV